MKYARPALLLIAVAAVLTAVIPVISNIRSVPRLFKRNAELKAQGYGSRPSETGTCTNCGDRGVWLERIVRGYDQYHAVPVNTDRLGASRRI